MKMKKIFLSIIAIISFCGAFSYSELITDASSIRYYTPKSWRGTYHSSNGSEMKVTAHSVSYNGKTFYKSSWTGWHKLAFSKVTKTTYTFNALAKYGYQSSRMWKLKHKNGNTYLVNYQIMGQITYWKKYIKPKLIHGYYMADSTNFYYNTWRGAFVNYNASLYKTKKDAAYEKNEVRTINNPKTKFYAKWLGEYQNDPYQDVIKIKYGSNYYYANNKNKDFIPYNTYYYDGSFISEFKPTQKSKIYLKHGRRVHTNDKWSWLHGKNDNYITSYTYKNGKWYKIKTTHFKD